MSIDALVARCVEAPDDDGPRLVLADALIERGDLWGEIIVLSCKVNAEEDPNLRQRISDLRAQRWPTKDFAGSIRRGFFYIVWANDGGVRQIVGPEFSLVHQLRIRNMTEAGVAALAELPPLHVNELRLECDSKRRVPGEGVTRAIANKQFRKLVLRYIDIVRADLEVVCAMNMRALEITQHELPDFEGLAWPALESLELGLGLETSHVRALASCAALHGLTELDLRYSRLDGEAAFAIAEAPFRNLTRLCLSAAFTTNGLERLAASRHLRGLQRLALSGRENLVDVSVLGVFGELTDLDLELQTTAEAQTSLFSNLRARLHKLRLRSEGFEGVPLSAPALRELRHLELSYVPIADQGAIAIAAADLPHLEKLDLAGCQIGPIGAAALAASKTLPNDLQISLYNNDLGPHIDALRARFPKMTSP